jgi:hypothetical protein
MIISRKVIRRGQSDDLGDLVTSSMQQGDDNSGDADQHPDDRDDQGPRTDLQGAALPVDRVGLFLVEQGILLEKQGLLLGHPLASFRTSHIGMTAEIHYVADDQFAPNLCKADDFEIFPVSIGDRHDLPSVMAAGNSLLRRLTRCGVLRVIRIFGALVVWNATLLVCSRIRRVGSGAAFSKRAAECLFQPKGYSMYSAGLRYVAPSDNRHCRVLVWKERE